jgi:hypothetical protein
LNFLDCVFEVFDSKVVNRFVLENVAHQCRDPLLVVLRRSGVPAIQTVKLDTADIAATTFEKLVIRVTYFPERIQTPRAALATKTENAAKVIGKDGSSKPSAVDESRGLENVFVLISDLLSTLRIMQGDAVGFRIRLTFVNFKQFVGDVVMVPVEQHEQHADGRWKQHKTVLSKRVGKHQSAAIMSADLVGCLLIIPIQWPKVDI